MVCCFVITSNSTSNDCMKEVLQPILCLPLYCLCLQGAPPKNLFAPYIKPLFAPFLPMLLQADFLSCPPTTFMERMHRFSCRVITGCLSSTPIPLLHLEAFPPFRVTLTHQSFSYFERAFRLPSFFPLASLVHHNPRTRLKNGSCRSF